MIVFWVSVPWWNGVRLSLIFVGAWGLVLPFATIISFTLLQSVIASRSLLFNVSFSLLVKKKGGVKRGGEGAFRTPTVPIICVTYNVNTLVIVNHQITQ